MKEPRNTDIYCSTYCNMGHRISTGRPVGHECRIIPPAALQAESEGDYKKAIEILDKAPFRIVKGRPAPGPKA